MITHNIPYRYKTAKHPKLSRYNNVCSYGIFKGRKNESKIAVVNESSVFEPLKFYCNSQSKKVKLKKYRKSSVYYQYIYLSE